MLSKGLQGIRRINQLENIALKRRFLYQRNQNVALLKLKVYQLISRLNQWSIQKIYHSNQLFTPQTGKKFIRLMKKWAKFRTKRKKVYKYLSNQLSRFKNMSSSHLINLLPLNSRWSIDRKIYLRSSRVAITMQLLWKSEIIFILTC